MDTMTVLLTAGIAFGVFLIMALFLALKKLFRKTTPLKAHACDVMCKHGKPQVCSCEHDEGDHDEGDHSEREE